LAGRRISEHFHFENALTDGSASAVRANEAQVKFIFTGRAECSVSKVDLP
jgi:hypothetical protein